jgi:nicotinamidase-related amidase
LVPELGIQPGDVIVAKRQWGAFYGTDLEQQLRRRGIKTIIIGGIATNMGVESTARAAFDHGYELIFVEDAMTSNRDELHHFAIQNLFPVMGRVRSTEQIIEAIG